MKSSIVSRTLLTLAAAATAFLFFRRGDKKGTIVLYLDKNNVCQTITTPFFKAFKANGKVKWKIDDEFDCLGNNVVRIVFDKPGYPDIFPSCSKEGRSTIECSLEGVNPTLTKYSVYIGTRRTEDPELQIEV